MQRSKLRLIAVVAAVVMLASGCVGTLSNVPKAEELSSLKGMSTAAVLKRYGKPYRRTITSEGEIWVYATPSPKKSAMNNMSKIGTFGMAEVPYVDAVTLNFHNDRVTKYAMENEVANVKLMGL